MRQGDPLSTLLFCRKEEVFSRDISHLVNTKQLQLIKSTRNHEIPSRSLYTDDIMLFFITSPSNIHALLNILSRYAKTSSQIINPNESTIYGGSISQARLNHIPSSLSFNIGTLTFLYIWVPIFKWRLKKIYFQPIMDKVKVKLASWKANLLSFASRIQFIKSFLHGMLVIQ